MGPRFAAPWQLDAPDGAKRRAVVEPELGGTLVEGIGIDHALDRRGAGEPRWRLPLPGRDEPCDGMEGQRLVRQAQATAQLPVSLLFCHEGAYLPPSAPFQFQPSPPFPLP